MELNKNPEKLKTIHATQRDHTSNREFETMHDNETRGLFGWWGKWGKWGKFTPDLPLRCQTCEANVVGQMFCPLIPFTPKR
jgi:hypothetical protein